MLGRLRKKIPVTGGSSSSVQSAAADVSLDEAACRSKEGQTSTVEELSSVQMDDQAGQNTQVVEPDDSAVEALDSSAAPADGISSLAASDEETKSIGFADKIAEQEKLIAELRESVDRLRSEAEENRDKYLRSLAELENFRKRAIRERSELLQYAGEHLARDLLDVVDSLELAVTHESTSASNDMRTGIRMILEQIKSVLERHSIRGESAKGKQFDPKTQQALTTVPNDEVPPGTVLEELKKFYFFKDKLLRAGQVVVAAASPPPANSAESTESPQSSALQSAGQEKTVDSEPGVGADSKDKG